MKMLRITLEGKTYDVGVEILDEGLNAMNYAPHAPAMPLQSAPFPTMAAPVPAVATHAPAVAPPPPQVAAPSTSPAAVPVAGCRAVLSPMAGMVFKCLSKPGDVVTLNQVLMVLDAMKMETPIYAPVAGTVRAVLVKEGDAVDDGQTLLQIEELAQ